MKIETQRLLIRDVTTEDQIPFVKMAADGSLSDCGFDRDCGHWIAKWTDEARSLALRDNPHTDYLAYTITLKSEDAVIGSVGCSYYEDLQKQVLHILSGHNIEKTDTQLKQLKHIPTIFSIIIVQKE